MGGDGSGRPPKIENVIKRQYENPYVPQSDTFILPNLSGVQHEIKSGTHAITTDDLAEGTTNLYYTGGRAVAAVAAADDYIKNDANDATTGILTAASFVASGSSGTSANWDTAYTHSQDNTQAHSDYLLNNADDTTSGKITWSGGDSDKANTAYTHSQVAGGNSVHVSTTENTNWDTAYSHTSLTNNPHSVTLAQVGGTTDHTALSNIGTNTHAQIDTAITNSVNHIADNTQAHSDYMLNTGDTCTGNYTFDTDTLFIDATNNRVGIGTESPQAGMKMDVRSDGSTAGSSAITAYGYNGEGGKAIQGYGYATAGTGNNYGIYGNSDGSRAGGVNIGGYFTASGAATNYALITGTGNVGIGTTSPQYKLDVRENGAGNKVSSFFRNDDITAGNYNFIDVGQGVSGGTYHAYFGTNTAGTIKINSDSLTASHLVIDTTGNVGIGTTAPTSPLQISNLPRYANLAAAIAGGLTSGALFVSTYPDPTLYVVV